MFVELLKAIDTIGSSDAPGLGKVWIFLMFCAAMLIATQLRG